MSVTTAKAKRGACELVSLAVFPWLLAACGDAIEDARAELSERWSCPIERIEVRVRDDLDGAKIFLDSMPKAVPPADVAADPTRLELFQRNETQRLEPTAKHYGRATLIDGQGCNHSAQLFCWRRSKKGLGERWFQCRDRP